MSVEEALADAIRRDVGIEGIVTRWVCVVEIMDSETQVLNLCTVKDDESPPWTHRGMLDSAIVEVDDEDE